MDTLKRLHMWVGLFNLTALIVFALTGISLSLPDRGGGPSEERIVDYEAPDDFSDKQVADDLFAKLDIPLVKPIAEQALRRDGDNALVLSFYSPNGLHRVTVLEEEKKVSIEHTRTSIGRFVSATHGMNLLVAAPDLRSRLWGLYIDVAIFSLMFMVVAGVWLWLASRPRLWWARLSFGAGVALFVFLWIATR